MGLILAAKVKPQQVLKAPGVVGKPGPALPNATEAQPDDDNPEDSADQNQTQVVERKEWCERGDSNPHGLPRQILSLVRLPIPPLSHESTTCRDAACHVSHSNAGRRDSPRLEINRRSQFRFEAAPVATSHA